MAGRDHVKGDANRKDGAVKKFVQQFCKLFLAAESGERLRIPPSFSQYLPNHPTGLSCLKGPSGNTWLAELSSDTEGLFFGYGWKKFVMDHSIESGHILTFCYDGRSQFSVVVFDGMCIEKPSAFHAKPSKDLVGTIESDEEDKEMSIVPQEKNIATKKNRQIDTNGSTLRKHSSGHSVGYKAASHSSTEDSDSSYHVSEESIACNESSKSVPSLPKFSKDVDISGKKQGISHNKSSKSVPPVVKFNKEADIHGKTIAVVQRHSEVISQRPPVSKEQKKYALQKAKQYKSKYPKTVVIMKETYVYKTYFMTIPSEFVRAHLPHTQKKLTLWDPQGKAWEVTYVYCTLRRAGAFSGGWGKFSIGNHLEMFDVCVFELFSEDNIKVHVYRASTMLFPYLPDSESLVNKRTI